MEDTKTETSGQVEHEDTSKAPGNEKKDDDKDGENSQKEHEVQSQVQEASAASADGQQPGTDSGKGSDPSGHSSEGGNTPTEQPVENKTPLHKKPVQETKTDSDDDTLHIGKPVKSDTVDTKESRDPVTLQTTDSKKNNRWYSHTPRV
eukprot:Tbor_TRINITY_DN5984_c0_g1::TRINITY_DN5984_c0_g1_i7::g.18415::m.18415